jgi:hypothetical protein
MKPRSRLQIYYGLYFTGILASVILAAVLSPFLFVLAPIVMFFVHAEMRSIRCVECGANLYRTNRLYWPTVPDSCPECGAPTS